MNNIRIFQNEQFGQVRIAVNENGEPLFCLADVCRSLDLDQPSRVKPRLKQDGVTTIKVIDSMNRQQDANFITESNLYKCIFQSRKEEAEEYLKSVSKILNVGFSHIIKSKRGKGGGTYGFKHVVVEYAQYLDSRKADFAAAALKKIRFSFGDIKSLRSFAVLQNIIYYVQGIFYALEASILKIYREVVSVYHSLWRMMFCSKNGYGFSFFISNK